MMEGGFGMMLPSAKGYQKLLATLEAKERYRRPSFEPSERA